MDFFVPHAVDTKEADHVWDATRKFLASQGFETEARKIWKLAHSEAGERQTIRVGEYHPAFSGMVLVILRALDRGAYYVCTPEYGVFQGSPHIVDNSGIPTLAVEFR